MIPSAMGHVALRLEVQLLKTAVNAMSTIAIRNNFFILFFLG
jgi:hypothetical protein